MTQIMELMEKRAKAWEAAKAFLIPTLRTAAMVSAEDAATYDKMEKEVTDLTRDIERLQRQERDREDDESADFLSAHPKPGDRGQPDEKTGRASAAYKKAFWDNIRHPGNPVIRDVLEEGTDGNGGYLVPIEFEHTLVQALNENNIMRTIGCKIITTQNERKIPCGERSHAGCMDG
jgi:HK97 family phage major capsid protein